MDPVAPEPAGRQEAIGPSQEARKLVVKSVLSHDKFLDMIKERNPIVARRLERR